MIKHFANRKAAEEDLQAFGFIEDRDGEWSNAVCVAMIHPLNGSDRVRVSYWHDNAGHEQRDTSRNLHDM
jgi:hypothetical protein